MARPLIGITAYAEPEVSWDVWRQPAALVPLAYVTAVEAAGGKALLVPPSEDGVEETVAALDGLLVSGGPDVDPGLYGEAPHAATARVHDVRDRAELALLTAALDRDLPVLAVCRGSQLLNVARGGALVQHLPEVVGHESHREKPGTFSDHEVTVRTDSRLGEVIGERTPVKSHHHQGLGRIGDGLVETAWAEDGTVEGVEDPQRRFALGVLWHPEEGDDAALFRALVEEARLYRQRRLTGTVPGTVPVRPG